MATNVSSLIYASETVRGTTVFATDVEADGLELHLKAVSPKTLGTVLGSYYDKTEIDGFLAGFTSTGDANDALALKANVADVYTKIEVNEALNLKLDATATATNSDKLGNESPSAYGKLAEDQSVTGNWGFNKSILFDGNSPNPRDVNQVEIGNNIGIKWSRNTDGATIAFHSDGESEYDESLENVGGDSKSWLMFVTHGDNNEWFQWATSTNTFDADPLNPEDDSRQGQGNKGTYMERMSLKGNDLRVRGTMIWNVSDERVKDVQEFLSPKKCLSAVTSWRPIRYRPNQIGKEYAHLDDKVDIGLIAGDVEKDFPELTPLAPFDTDFVTGQSKSGEDYKTLRYERTVGVLTGAVQALNEQNLKQQRTIDDLVKRLEALEAKCK